MRILHEKRKDDKAVHSFAALVIVNWRKQSKVGLQRLTQLGYSNCNEDSIPLNSLIVRSRNSECRKHGWFKFQRRIQGRLWGLSPSPVPGKSMGYRGFSGPNGCKPPPPYKFLNTPLGPMIKKEKDVWDEIKSYFVFDQTQLICIMYLYIYIHDRI